MRSGLSAHSRRFVDVARALITDLLNRHRGGHVLLAGCKTNQGRAEELIKRSETRRLYSVSAGRVSGLRARTPNIAT
jgi:hypothetical protein